MKTKEQIENILDPKLLEVKSQEIKIVPINAEQRFVTYNIGSEIAIALHSFDLNRSALCRNVNSEQLIKCIKEMNGENKKDVTINMQLVGGVERENVNEYLKSNIFPVMKSEIEDFISLNVTTILLGDTPHPENLLISCYHGSIL